MAEFDLLLLLPNIIGICLGLHIAGKVYQQTPSSQRSALLSAFLSVSFLSFIWAIEKLVPEQDLQLALTVIEYALEVGILTSLLFFSFKYSGVGDQLGRRVLITTVLLGAVMVLINATNGYHHLFYSKVVIETYYEYYLFKATYGPLYISWILYVGIILLVTLALLMKAYWEAMDEKRRSIGFFILAIAVYFLFSFSFAVSKKDPRFDLLSIGLSISVVLVYGANKKNILIDHYRITLPEAIRSMDDGVVITGLDDQAVYTNDIARGLMDEKALRSFMNTELDGDLDLKIRTASEEREYSIVRSPIVRDRLSIGNVIVLRDITKRKMMERQLEEANHRIDTLNSVFRHDIMNELLVLDDHLAHLNEMDLDDDQAVHLQKARKTMGRINENINMVRKQRFLESRQTAWLDLGSTIDEGVGRMDLNGITFHNRIYGYQVLADQMLSKVFQNLMDNSIRHGRGVSTVSVHTENGTDRLRMIWEDDGIGVPTNEKEKIFQRGYGRNTGQGLFLIKEILGFTGMDITETGTPGEGARFVISIPNDAYRTETDHIDPK